MVAIPPPAERGPPPPYVDIFDNKDRYNQIALGVLAAAITAYAVVRLTQPPQIHVHVQLPEVSGAPLPVAPGPINLQIPGGRFENTPMLSLENYSLIWEDGDLTVRGTVNGPFHGIKVDQHMLFGETSRIERLIAFEGDQLTALQKAIGKWRLDDVLQVREWGDSVRVTHKLTGESFSGTFKPVWDQWS